MTENEKIVECPHCKSTYTQGCTLRNITIAGSYPHLTEGQAINIKLDGKTETYQIVKKQQNNSNNEQGEITFLQLEKTLLPHPEAHTIECVAPNDTEKIVTLLKSETE